MVEYNPFNPNSVVSHNLFAGRTTQVNNICVKLKQVKHGMPSSFFIYGERGIGKTALAKLILYISSRKEELYKLNFLTSFYIVEKGQNLSSVLQESINNLTNSMDKNLLDKVGERVGKLFNNGKFEIGAFGLNVGVDNRESQLQRDITIKDQTVSILQNIIKALDSDGKKKDGVLLVIDEIHNLADLPNSASVFRNISTTLDMAGLGKISFLLIGYEEDEKKFFSIDSSSRRVLDSIKLSVMPVNEAMEVLTKGFESLKLEWDQKALESNILVSGGYPHSIQLLGLNLIENNRDNIIDNEDWKQVILHTAVQLKDKDFASMYPFGKKLHEKDKVLIYLAESTSNITRTELLKNRLTTNTTRCLQQLKDIGAIYEDENSNIFLHSQLFRSAILIDTYARKEKQFIAN